MILDDLEVLLRERLVAAREGAYPEGSYSITLLLDADKARRKIMEEAFELTLELGRPEIDTERAAEEGADLLFHTLAGLVGAGVPLQSVMTVLEGRWQ
ncbi:MAG: phosphoribosyl-ATP diphosphatase [Nitriliruptorales bacterium]|nr:phosphoribosyl-ATP diphosphatase [Nitriliruptorales bacterium]